MRHIVAALIALLLCLFAAVPAQAHTPEEWSITFGTYRRVDAMCGTKHVIARLTDTEIAATQAAQKDMIAKLQAWNPLLRITATYGVREEVNVLRGNETTGCWVDKGDIPWASTGADSFIVVADPWDSITGDWWHKEGPGYKVLGTAWMCGACDKGYVFAVGAHYSDMNRIYTHEWLHIAGSWYRSQGAHVPDVHEYDAYGEDDDFTWYKRIVQADLPDLNGDGRVDGISHYARERGTPNGV